MTSPGSPTADNNFTSLLESVLEPAYRTAYHLTRNEADAEELVQEAALLAYKGFDRFELGTNFKGWFITILRNRFISGYRKKKREVPTVELEDAPDLYMYNKSLASGLATQTSEPAKYVIERLDAEQVANALAELPMEFREAATLYFAQDMAYQKIADVLNVPVGTVRSRLHRGRKLLQKKLWSLAEDYGLVSEVDATEDVP